MRRLPLSALWLPLQRLRKRLLFARLARFRFAVAELCVWAARPRVLLIIVVHCCLTCHIVLSNCAVKAFKPCHLLDVSAAVQGTRATCSCAITIPPLLVTPLPTQPYCLYFPRPAPVEPYSAPLPNDSATW